MGCLNASPLKKQATHKNIFEENNYYDVTNKEEDESNDKRKRAFYLIN